MLLCGLLGKAVHGHGQDTAWWQADRALAWLPPSPVFGVISCAVGINTGVLGCRGQAAPGSEGQGALGLMCSCFPAAFALGSLAAG